MKLIFKALIKNYPKLKILKKDIRFHFILTRNLFLKTLFYPQNLIILLIRFKTQLSWFQKR